MGSITKDQALDKLRNLEEDLTKGRNDRDKSRLIAVGKTCRAMIDIGATISIDSVRKWLANHESMIIPASSFSNKYPNKQSGRKEHASYSVLLREYIKTQQALLALKQPRMRKESSDPSELPLVLLDDSELTSISDQTVRYKVQLLMGRASNLNKQLQAARTLSKMPTIPHNFVALGNDEHFQSSLEPEAASALDLDEDEIAAVENFLNEKILMRKGLSYNENGALTLSPGHSHPGQTKVLSDPELQQALRKILERIQPR